MKIKPFLACFTLSASLVVPQFLSRIQSAALAADLSFNGQAVSALGDATQLSLTENRISGVGSFVFEAKLDTIGDESSHALSFTLKDGGALTFVTYADPSLGQGLEFHFAREGTRLVGMVKKSGVSKEFDFSAELANINASRVIHLQLDVHNSEAPAHLLVWEGLESSFSEDNALLNTEETDGSPGNGAGLRRGFILNGATLLKAVATEAKFDH
jgi:hypothetical protein